MEGYWIKWTLCWLLFHSLLNPTDRMTRQIPNHEPMKPPKDRGKNEGSQIDSLVPVVPQVGPGVGQAGKESDLSFDFKRQGNGRGVNDKEEKIGKHHLAFGIDMAVEKHQERGKRMDDEQSRAQNQAVLHRVIRHRDRFRPVIRRGSLYLATTA